MCFSIKECFAEEIYCSSKDGLTNTTDVCNGLLCLWLDIVWQCKEANWSSRQSSRMQRAHVDILNTLTE